jgi:hypothetical protein
MNSVSINFSSVKSPFKIIVDEKVTNNVNDLVGSNTGNDPTIFYISQTKEFQEWRIYDNPNYEDIHTYSVYDQADNRLALIVLNSHKNGVAYIIQSNFSVVLSESDKVKILRFVVKSMFHKGIGLIRNWNFNSNQANKIENILFKKAKFILLNKGIGFVWKELDSIQFGPNSLFLSRISTEGTI